VVLEGHIEGSLVLDITATDGNSGNNVIIEFTCKGVTCSLDYNDLTNDLSPISVPPCGFTDKDRTDRVITTREDPDYDDGSIIVSVCALANACMPLLNENPFFGTSFAPSEVGITLGLECLDYGNNILDVNADIWLINDSQRGIYETPVYPDG
jgi:hypothetical protein